MTESCYWGTRMGNEQKDRLGDKLRDIEKGREDDYFARRDRELLEKMKREKVSPVASQGGGADGGGADGENKGER